MGYFETTKGLLLDRIEDLVQPSKIQLLKCNKIVRHSIERNKFIDIEFVSEQKNIVLKWDFKTADFKNNKKSNYLSLFVHISP